MKIQGGMHRIQQEFPAILPTRGKQGRKLLRESN